MQSIPLRNNISNTLHPASEGTGSELGELKETKHNNKSLPLKQENEEIVCSSTSEFDSASVDFHFVRYC
jgi:hypothetical protein